MSTEGDRSYKPPRRGMLLSSADMLAEMLEALFNNINRRNTQKEFTEEKIKEEEPKKESSFPVQH